MKNWLPMLSLTLVAGMLAACGQSETKSESAEDYAARVGGLQSGAPASASAAPTATTQAAPPATPVPPGTRGSALAAGSERCNAPAAAAFVNQPDTPETRSAIAEAVGGGTPVRFMPPGTSGQIGSQSSRLNVMVDYTGVIRDLRCG